MFTLMSCDDGGSNSYAPVYGKMLFNPSVAAPGDSVTVSVEQAQKGYGLESTTYSWSIRYYVETEDGTLRDSIQTFSKHTNYDGTDNGDPTLRFYLPTNCVGRSVAVSLHANFSAYIGNTLFLQASKSGSLPLKD